MYSKDYIGVILGLDWGMIRILIGIRTCWVYNKEYVRVKLGLYWGYIM